MDILRTLVEVDGWWNYRPPGSVTAFDFALRERYAQVAAAS
jgi:hypothetical protein